MVDARKTNNRNWTLFWLIVGLSMTATGALLMAGSFFGA